MKLLSTLLFLTATLPLTALDWGLSLEDSTSGTLNLKTLTSSTFGQTETARFWVNQDFDRQGTLLLKTSVADAFSYGFAPGPLINTVTADLDTLVFSADKFTVGRTFFRDFGGVILNTTLDGIQWSPSFPGIDLTLAAGTTVGLFKDQSTVVISQADLVDRTVTENFLKPATLFAPPRAVAYTELAFKQLLTDQTFRWSAVAQYDFRQGVATAGDAHSRFSATDKTAPVSMLYSGLGGAGRLVGTLYWDAWAYAGVGQSLTGTGPFAQEKVDRTQDPVVVTPEVKQTWKTSYIVNGIGMVDVTWLAPELAFSILNLSVQVGSWDPDGISPDQNLPTNGSDGSTPSLYTGYFGVSRTGGSLIFSPQPVNMITSQLLYSFKPFGQSKGPLSNFQVAATGYVFVRPTLGAITESGAIAHSKEHYLASEGDLNFLFRPAADWGGNVSFGVLVPNAAALSRGIEVKAQLGLSLSL